MKKFKIKSRAGKNSSILNSSVSTYGKIKIRNIAEDLRWLEIQDKPKKGLFSDSEDNTSDVAFKSTIFNSSNSNSDDHIFQISNPVTTKINNHVIQKLPRAQNGRIRKKTAKKNFARRKPAKPNNKENTNSAILAISSSGSLEAAKPTLQEKLPSSILLSSDGDTCALQTSNSIRDKFRMEKHNSNDINEKDKSSVIIPEDSPVVPQNTFYKENNALPNSNIKVSCLNMKNLTPDLFNSCCVLLSRLRPKFSNHSSKIPHLDQNRNATARSNTSISVQSTSDLYKDVIKPCSVILSRESVSLKSTTGEKSSNFIPTTKNEKRDLSYGHRWNCWRHKQKASSLRPRKRSKLRCSLSFSSPSMEGSDLVSEMGSQMDNSCSFFTSKCQQSLVALHSSKRGCVTNNRRHRKSNFKITDGVSFFSFSEHIRAAQDSLLMFQNSVIIGHDSRVDNFFPSFENHQNFSSSKKHLIQSTPYLKSSKKPFSVEVTPFNVPKVSFNISSEYPMSSTPSLKDLSAFVSKGTDTQLFLQQMAEDLSSSFEGFSSQLIADDDCINKVLSECNQVKPQLFENLNYDEKSCQKLGEGVYGEVFKCSSKHQAAIAVKIVPVNGKDKINNELQKTFSEILPEIVNSSELSGLSEDGCNKTDAFIHLFGVHCVIGKYPEFLLKAWDEYGRNRATENQRPDFFPPTQHYVVFEFTDGGTDLENFQFRNAAQALSVLKQTIAGLAVAEEVYQFEHRDLHWGNILVEQNSGKKSVEFTLDGVTQQIKCVDVTARIIDFTFSRMTKGGLSLFHDLSSDDDLFTGNSNVDYQFEIYRMMKEETNNNWSQYKPKTNVFWIHYLLNKFLNDVPYRLKKTKLHSNAMRILRSFYDTVLDFCSCREIVLKSTLFNT